MAKRPKENERASEDLVNHLISEARKQAERPKWLEQHVRHLDEIAFLLERCAFAGRQVLSERGPTSRYRSWVKDDWVPAAKAVRDSEHKKTILAAFHLSKAWQLGHHLFVRLVNEGCGPQHQRRTATHIQRAAAELGDFAVPIADYFADTAVEIDHSVLATVQHHAERGHKVPDSLRWMLKKTATTTSRAARGGRPPCGNPFSENRLLRLWKDGRNKGLYKTHAEFARAAGQPVEQMKGTLERARMRKNRASQPPRTNPRSSP